jgi:protein associated with RNAse G/E
VSFRTDQAQVSVIPRNSAFVATFYAPGGTAHCDVYVDITTIPVWSGGTVSAVDLDLDVVRGWTGRVWVDDEDEFAEHRVTLAYPSDLVRLAVTSCADVRSAVEARLAPYDGSAGAWLDVLDAVTRDLEVTE